MHTHSSQKLTIRHQQPSTSNSEQEASTQIIIAPLSAPQDATSNQVLFQSQQKTTSLTSTMHSHTSTASLIVLCLLCKVAQAFHAALVPSSQFRRVSAASSPTALPMAGFASSKAKGEASGSKLPKLKAKSQWDRSVSWVVMQATFSVVTHHAQPFNQPPSFWVMLLTDHHHHS